MTGIAVAKAVFLHKPSSVYDDNPTERYHFPSTYLRSVEQTVGDFIVYFEPKRGGSQRYVATAQVVHIDPDPNDTNLFYARIDPTSYIPFSNPLEYQGAHGFFERSLRSHDGTINRGLIQRAVRLLDDEDYGLIVREGLRDVSEWPLEDSRRPEMLGFSDKPQASIDRTTTTIDRKARSRAFTVQIQDAYDRTCAVTGLRILNGNGRPEVQAAHIKAVEDDGPDWVRNGVALSGTVHWMFDRGLISVADDHRILRAEKLIPEEIRPLLQRSDYLRIPANSALAPHPAFLRHHRESRYKGD